MRGSKAVSFWEVLRLIQEKRYEDALKTIACAKSDIDSGELSYYEAIAAYGMKKYSVAEQLFLEHLQFHVMDEIAWFYLGNSCFRQGNWNEALKAYSMALERRKDFTEVLINIGLVAINSGDDATARALAKEATVFHGIFEKGTLCEDPLEYSLAISSELSIRDIPIFINSRDRLTALKRVTEWLLHAGYRRIYIIDNASTYSPLLQYYRALDKNEPTVKVLRLKKNLGHMALWDSKVLEILQIDTPYVYTDSDIIPTEDCPPDVLADLLEIMQKYPILKKVGLGLKTDDITFFDAEGTQAEEYKYYPCKLEDELYFGSIFTTFALYRNYRHYSVDASARTTGKKMARHSQWYFDYEHLPEDEQYYFDHANESARLVAKMKDAMQYFLPIRIKEDGREKNGEVFSETLQGTPLVSVVMTVYNGGKYLAEAIDSILGQTYTNWELLVVDDGSTDNSRAILQLYEKRDDRIKILLHEVNKGLPAARNTGIENARGKYVALMDADDISMPKRLAMQTAFMERCPDVDVCGVFCRTFDAEDGRFYLKPVWDKEIKLNLLFVCTFVSASAMLRTSSLKKHRLLFDESWKIVEDYEFWCRAANRLKYHNLPHVLYLYRITISSLSKANPERMSLATQKIIAHNLNQISDRSMTIPAFYKIDCTDEDWQIVINELRELPFHLKPSCPFTKEEIQIVSDFLIRKCENILEARRSSTAYDD